MTHPAKRASLRRSPRRESSFLDTFDLLDVAKTLGFELDRNGKGRCVLPGHNDVNPSFSADRKKQVWFCHACGVGGKTLGLVQAKERLSKVEALDWLIRRARSADPWPSPASPSRATSGPPRQAACAASAPDLHVYEALIDLCPLSGRGHAYLATRGIGAAIVAQARVAELRDGREVHSRLAARFGHERLVACGVGLSGRNGARLAFDGPALLFPFVEGEAILSMQARSLNPEARPHWRLLNGMPSVPYGVGAALGGSGQLWICEGVMDALTAIQMGRCALALTGAAKVLPDHVARAAVGREIYVVSDADNAGDGMWVRLRNQFSRLGIPVDRQRIPPPHNDLNDWHVATGRGV